MSKPDLDRLLEIVAQGRTFVVAAHLNPDGDAVGSSLGMALALRALGKDVVVYNRDPVPYNFQFLPGQQLWTQSLDHRGRPDVTILLDCGEPGRVGEEFPEHGWGEQIVVIDHHKTYDPNFATHYVRDVSAAATGELVYDFAQMAGVDPDGFADNIYCCLVTDTGSFRYSNTSQRTFNIAGELIARGVDPWHITSHVYESQPRERLALLGRVLQTLRFSDDGTLAFLRIEQHMLDDTGASLAMIDGFINFARSVQGVEVATQLKQTGPQSWAVSFRSRGAVDVSRLAAAFGGGGHHNAAGCTVSGTAEEIEAELSATLTGLLAS